MNAEACSLQTPRKQVVITIHPIYCSNAKWRWTACGCCGGRSALSSHLAVILVVLRSLRGAKQVMLDFRVSLLFIGYEISIAIQDKVVYQSYQSLLATSLQ